MTNDAWRRLKIPTERLNDDVRANGERLTGTTPCGLLGKIELLPFDSVRRLLVRSTDSVAREHASAMCCAVLSVIATLSPVTAPRSPTGDVRLRR